MRWPPIALVFVFALASALATIERRARIAIILVSVFTVLSVADYYPHERPVQALLRG